MPSIRKEILDFSDIDKGMAWFDSQATKLLNAGKQPYLVVGYYDESDKEEPKSDIQREKFHAMIGDIQKTGVIVIPGRKIVMSNYTADKCKALLVMWFANEMRDIGEPIPNPPENFECPLTGETITIRPSTTKWGKKITQLFVEFLYATGAMSGTRWSEKALKEYESYKQAQQ